jgi:ATP-binding cassette subfamily F protein 3
MSELATLEERFARAGGYDLERRAEVVLAGVGLSGAQLDQEANSLSGGEQSRLALARLLLDEQDLWLLDEPTNHLDLDGLTFLEEFLSRSAAAAIVVSHDRSFLDAVTTETWEIEGGKLWVYPAPYSRARELRDERLKAAWREFRQQQEFVARQEEYVRRYGAGQRAKEARGRAKRLARLERFDRPADRIRAMAFRLPDAARLGDRVLAVRGLSARAGDRTLFEDLEFELDPGEALGVVGPNGTGKTTLLELLDGALGEGGPVTWGSTVDRAKLTQHETFDDLEATPLGFLQSCGCGIGRSGLLDILGAMLFGAQDAEKTVRMLSGGERKRLVLTRMMLAGHNVLLLDEPTNHLDTYSREALESALTGYDGTIVVVSHDRYFLDRIADRILWIEDGSWRLTRGGFTEAAAIRRAERERERELTAAAQPKRAPKSPPPRPPQPKRAKSKSPHARLTTDELEQRIIECEEKRTALQWRLSEPDVVKNAGATRDIRAEIATVVATLAELNAEYESRDV